ncbi:MAG: hypothetical protein WA151_12065, partial [Desulfatirhabdiaceae bacterium]
MPASRHIGISAYRHIDINKDFMNPYQLYRDINRELDRGNASFIEKGDSGIRFSGTPEPHN